MVPKELQGLDIQGSMRMDCPFCGHKNSFSISDQNGILQWNCFYSLCKARGKVQKERNIYEIRSRLADKRDEGLDDGTYTIPDYFTSVLSNPQAIRYLKNNNCFNAFVSHRAKFRYDPKQSRVVFLCYDEEILVGAVGRRLWYDPVQPKWLRYDHNQALFVTSGEFNKHVGILVEDAASACAVSSCGHGVALLGSSLSPFHLDRLRKYSHVLICLDPDATKKALHIHKQLSWFTHASIIRLEDDLKYFNEKEVSEFLQPWLEEI